MCLVNTCAGYKHCILIEELITLDMLIYNLILCSLAVMTIEYAQYQRFLGFFKSKPCSRMVQIHVFFQRMVEF